MPACAEWMQAGGEEERYVDVEQRSVLSSRGRRRDV